MDPSKTLFISGLPQGVTTRTIDRAFKVVGCEAILQLDPPWDGCAFVQMSTAAQIKITLEALSETSFQAVTSERTKEWISRTSQNATAPSVTRMSMQALRTRIKSSLGPKTASGGHHHMGRNYKTGESEVAPPDGTLLDSYEADDLAKIRAEVAAFRQATRSRPVPKLPELLPEHESKQSTPWDQFLARQEAWAMAARRADEDAEERFRLALADQLHRDVDRIAERQMDAELFPETIESNEEANVTQKVFQASAPSASAPSASTQASSSGAEDVLEALVETYFGEKDQDVVEFVRDHLRHNGSEANLAQEFAEVLGSESEEFAHKIHRLNN